MTKNEYMNKRNALIKEAQALIDEGKIEDAAKKRGEIEVLDENYENAAKESANLNALKNINQVKPPINMAETIGHEAEEKLNQELYRTAFFKKIMGKEMTSAEKVAFDSGASSAGAAIPTETANEIIRKLKERAPLLSEITLLQVAGNVTFAIEGTVAEAQKHTENAAITPDADTLVKVTLGGYEITKLIQVSDTVSTMSIDAFEGWLTDMIVEAVADKISGYIILGTGSSEPQGIEKAITWGADNSITVATGSSLTAANVQALIGLLGGGYDPNAKFIMSKKTLFNDFMPLQDKSKFDIVTREGRQYFVYGYPVLIDSRVALHDAYLGDLKKVVGNLPETITLRNDYDISTNSKMYLGVAMFDCKVAITEAFVKLTKTAG